MMFFVLILGIAMFVSFYLVGSLFLQFSVKKEGTFLQHVVNSWVGLLLVVALFAIVKTVFVTILVLLPFILFSFKNEFVFHLDGKVISSLKFVVVSVFLYVILFFLQVNFNLGFLFDPFSYLSYIHPVEDERLIYSTIISLLHYEGRETISVESILNGASGVSLYHFIEFWLASYFKTFYNVKSDIVLLYFIYPVFKTFTVLAVCSIFSDNIKSKKDLYLVGAIIFCFVILGFKMIFPPVYKMALRDIMFVPMIVLVCKFLSLKEYDASAALLMVASVENILFIPALFVFYLIFYRGYTKVALLKGVIFVCCYCAFYYFFKEDVKDKYLSLGVVESLKSLFSSRTINQVYRTLLGGLLSFPMRVLMAYLVVSYFMCVKYDRIGIKFGIWVATCFVVYLVAFALFFEISIDANQFQILVYILISVSFFFTLYYLLKNKQIIVCIVLLLLTSDYTYPFGKIELSKGYEVELENRLEVIGNHKVIKGFFIDENQILEDQWYLKYYPAYFTAYARANDYRTYLFNYDIHNLRGSIDKLEPLYQPILYTVIQPKFSLNNDVLENARRNKVSVIWINKNSKYLNSFKQIKVLYELKDYYVYYIDDFAR